MKGIYVGVSTVYSAMFESFDAERVVENILKSYKYKSGQSDYSGMTKAEILAQWDRAKMEGAEKGTHTHASLEAFFESLPPDDMYALTKQDVFQNQGLSTPGQRDLVWELYTRGWRLWRTEWRVASKEYGLRGIIDAVLYRPSRDEWAILDWKTNKDELKRDNYKSRKCGCTPVSKEFPDCDFYKYAIQLNLYRLMLEHDYGFTVDQLLIGHLPHNRTDVGTLIDDVPKLPYMDRLMVYYNTNLKQKATIKALV